MPQPPQRRHLAIFLAATLAAFIAAYHLPIQTPAKTSPTQPSPPPPAISPISPTSPPEPAAASALAILALPDDPDFFHHAASTLAAIEQLTAADFAAISARKKLPARFARKSLDLLSDTLHVALVERWLAVDPEGAPAALFALALAQADEYHRHGDEALSEALASAAPLAFLTAEKARLSSEYPDTSRSWAIALQTLAARDLSAAQRFAAELPERLRSAAAPKLAQGVAAIDPVAAIRLARALPAPDTFNVVDAALRNAERVGPGLVRQVFDAATGLDLNETTVTRLRLRFPDDDFSSLASNHIIGNGPTPRFDWYRSETPPPPIPPDEAQRRLEKSPSTEVATELLRDWAAAAPESAVTWAAKNLAPDEDDDWSIFTPARGEALQAAFEIWAEADEPAALAWLARQPTSSSQKSSLAKSTAARLADRGDIDQALHLVTSLDRFPIDDPTFIDYLATTATRRDPALAANWLLALPAEIDPAAPLHQTLSRWQALDAPAAREWAAALPPGKPHDIAAAALAEAAASRSLPPATPWVDAIADPSLRADAVRAIYRQHAQLDPAAARAWLRDRSELPPAERERLIHHQPPL